MDGVGVQRNISAFPPRTHRSHIGSDAREGSAERFRVEFINPNHLDVIGSYPHAARSNAWRCLVRHIGFKDGEVPYHHILGHLNVDPCASLAGLARSWVNHVGRERRVVHNKTAASNTNSPAVVAAAVDDRLLRNLDCAERSKRLTVYVGSLLQGSCENLSRRGHARQRNRAGWRDEPGWLHRAVNKRTGSDGDVPADERDALSVRDRELAALNGNGARIRSQKSKGRHWGAGYKSVLRPRKCVELCAVTQTQIISRRETDGSSDIQ
jgi:hypothetical protein